MSDDDSSVHDDPTKATAFTPRSAPRSDEEIPLTPGEDEADVDSKPHDPLAGIPSVPADVTGEVRESEVTDHQSAKATADRGETGQSEHPPASTAP